MVEEKSYTSFMQDNMSDVCVAVLLDSIRQLPKHRRPTEYAEILLSQRKKERQFTLAYIELMDKEAFDSIKQSINNLMRIKLLLEANNSLDKQKGSGIITNSGDISLQELLDSLE